MKKDPELISDRTFVDLFEEQVSRTPSAIALVSQDKNITYDQLHSRVNSLARYLVSKGVRQEEMVGICIERGLEMVIGILGILKAGAAYVPIDPAYPHERINFIINDTKTRLLLSSGDLRHIVSGFDNVAPVYLDEIEYNESNELTKLPSIHSGNLAYVIYTSGSTGMPKGVMIEHASLLNRLIWAQDYYQLTTSDVVLQKTTYCFDVSVWELLWPFIAGAKLIMAKPGGQKDNEYLKRIIESEKVTMLHFVPSMLGMFLHTIKKGDCSSLKKVLCSGEALKYAHVTLFKEKLPQAELHNLYGPTEAAIDVTYWDVNKEFDPQSEVIPIGRPVANTSIYILNEKNEKVQDGEAGELHIGGVQVGRGYLNKPELTNEKFIPDPFCGKAGGRMYKSGDLARILPDGNIEYLGRIDHQVKIRGFRIELGEIEYQLSRQDNIKEVVVTAFETKTADQKLIAYIQVKDPGQSQAKQIEAWRRHLHAVVPEYMVPDIFIVVPEFPLNASGKIDRKKLPPPSTQRPPSQTIYVKPVTDIEKKIAALWSALLLIDEVGVEDNFFELGGNSLLAQKVVNALKADYDLDVPITKLYQNPTITGIQKFLKGEKRTLRTPQKKRTIQAATDIAVIGMECNFPGAGTIEAFWDILVKGKETTHFFSAEELDKAIPDAIRNDPAYVKARGIIEDVALFDAAFFGISPKLAELMDPQHRLFLEVSRNLLEKTGYLPGKTESVTGVFAGCATNTYFNNNVVWHRDKLDVQGTIPVMSVSDKDYISSRVSYQLNLSGPAINVNTACSTSLVAIAQAVESLRAGQCDTAIAGGASITVPVNSGHLYQEGSMLSADGHCRPFDADAKGTVFSDGVGAVLLKRLDDAIEDGDTIYAVIKGVGINNDGGNKGSFTAPSAEGQAAAIAMAYKDAKIAPEKVSYIETHGTATPLGDPIEIEGLKIAFGDQDKKQFCAIGSVKSNFGHLTHAAGVAGFIKTVLSLYYKQLPPSINFSSPNPHIDFLSGPFIVNDKLKDWKLEGKRIAGVSSFGVGGTNAHVVLEEFVPGITEHKFKEKDQSQAICWSAHNEESGLFYADKLERFLQTHKVLSLRDIAASLILTREDLGVRNFVVAKNVEDLLASLKNKEAIVTNAYRIKEKKTNIVFLFPGQGNQYPNMGLGLYETEDVYKNAVDECAQFLQEYMGEDIRNIIFTEENDEAAADKLKNTKYAQPAIFTTSYALAKLYMSWGITPVAFAGHSVGEFVGAHLSGVFSLPDVLKIIAERGRLISELPAGSMLSVRASIDKVQSLLPAGLSIAAQNATELCVVSGETSLISEFSVTLTEAGIANKPLRTSHAFHSSMMEPAVSKLKAVVEQAQVKVPQIPVLSTVTAEWLKDSEALNAGYWADHARVTVMFGPALKRLQQELAPIFLEVGPGTSSTIFAKQNGTGDAAFASLNVSSSSADEAVSVKTALAKLWQYGAEIDWRNIYKEKTYQLLHNLPTYAYNNKRLWIDSPMQQTPVAAQKITETVNTTSIIPMNRKDTLLDKLKDIIESASGISVTDANPFSNFTELGLDSLLLTQLTTSLKKQFSIPVTFRQLSEDYDTLDKLAGFYDANLPESMFNNNVAYAQPTPVQGSSVTINTAPAYNNANAVPQAGSDMLGIMSLQLQLLTQQVAMMQQGAAPQNPALVQNNANVFADKNITVNTTEELTAEEKVELKKPFGATARIEKRSVEISEQQHQYITRFIEAYNKKTAESKRYTQQHRARMADPRVVSGFKPYTKEMVYPIVAQKSKGCYVWDIDGNKYIDALNGFGSNFFGYQPDFIKEALLQQVEEGYEIGPQHVLAGEVSDLVCELTGMDRAALCNTGSEAVLGAMRIARTVTGRDLIVAFSGSYHGITDEVLVRGSKKLKTYPAASGILAGNVQNMLILEYGTEASLHIIKERADEIAAVLVEPVQSRRPEFQPVAFLKDLRKLTSDIDVPLIFDEVITGFRSHLGGTQALFGIKADIATYGKVAGAGISIGIIAGSKKYMDALDGGYWEYGDDSIPEVGVTYFAGTFVRHPLALATTKAALTYLKSQGPGLQKEMNEKTDKLVARLNQITQKYRVPIYIVHFSSMWKIKFKEEYPYYELLFALLRFRNIHILDLFPCYLTIAHTQEDIDAICVAFEESIAELCKAGFIPQAENVIASPNGSGIKIIDNSTPPVPGARLGKDRNGDPAWFVPDENNPGKYLQISLDDK